MMRLRRFTANIVIPQAPLLWSDPATWGGAVPTTGDVTIPAGRIVILDIVAPATLGCIIIPKGATLQLASTGTIGFAGIDCIQVFGRFLGGSAGTPLTNPITITLNGVDPVWPTRHAYPTMLTNDTGMHRGVMVMAGGVMALYGYAPTPYTQLNATAAAAATALTTAVATGWKAGDEIAISPTGHWNQNKRTEKFTLGVDAVGTAITTTTGLGFDRWGQMMYPISVAPYTSTTQSTWSHGTGGGQATQIDQRAYVINMTRNLKINAANDAYWTGATATGVIVGATLTVSGLTQGALAVGQAITGTGTIQSTSVQGSISGTALTLGTSSTLYAGQRMVGNGIVVGTTIVSGSGTAYVVSVSQTAASTLIAFEGTTITALGSGTGGNGTYTVNINNAVPSFALTAQGFPVRAVQPLGGRGLAQTRRCGAADRAAARAQANI